MKNKKNLSIMAAGVMTLSILSGCGKKTEPTVAEKPAETTAPEVYKASASDFDERGWKAELSLTYEGAKIVKVEYDEVNKDGKKKSEDAGYSKAMKDAKTDKKEGITITEAYASLTETALKEDKVATVTGATTTAKSFEKLYTEAKAMKK
ncbi:MAG: hypothetical protein ACREV6_06335 [Clostridium sp.]|uniref:hypothetical protein n=1 Tax=Clostridium sp. TaxID=1506 RepID=UPI003D6CCA7C